jgi:hypothetical protein
MFGSNDFHPIAVILASPVLLALMLELPLMPALAATAFTALLLHLRVRFAGHWRLIVPEVQDTGD